MSKTENKLQPTSKIIKSDLSGLKLKIMSFGYKEGIPPQATLIFDVRFLKNPFWVKELKPFTGLDPAVQEYVMTQEAAQIFLDSLVNMLIKLLPELPKNNITEFSVALGCTGGQHRSVSIVEFLVRKLKETFADLNIECTHRELENKSTYKET